MGRRRGARAAGLQGAAKLAKILVADAAQHAGRPELPTLVEEVLSAWRDGERLLDELPAIHPDRETVAMSIASLKTLYAQLTDARESSGTTLRANHGTVERAHRLIREARARLGLDEPSLDHREVPG